MIGISPLLRVLGCGGLALALVTGAAPARASDLDTRMDRIERDMRQLQQDYYSSAQGGAAGGPAQGGATSQEGARLSERIDALEAALRDLRGQVEQTSFQQKQVLERLDAIDAKLGTAPPAPASQAAPAPPPGPHSDAGPGDSAPDNAPKTLASAGMQPPPPPPPAPPNAPSGSLGTLPDGAADAAEAAPAPTDEKGQFQAALGMLYSGNRQSGIKGLRDFIKQHPKSKQLPSAYYWLGEAQLADKSYRDAGEAFLTVVTKYQKDPVAPKSLVKLGSALIAGGQAKDGCKYLKSVKQVFPKADKSVVDMANRERKLGNCA